MTHPRTTRGPQPRRRDVAAAGPPAPLPEPRGARRKRETRQKLLRAAFQLIAERGVDAVAINEITEAADVGFGSFYNHFPSKELVYEAVFDTVFEEFGEGLDRLTSDVADPAELVAICVRHTIERARRERLWGRFFVREAFTARGMTRGLGARLLRDIRKGITRKRFGVTDPPMALFMAGGTVVATVAAEATWEEDDSGSLKRLGLGTKNVAERAAATILQGLGLPPNEAADLATRPLPAFDAPPSFEQ